VAPGTLELEAGAVFRRLSGDVNQVATPILLKLSATDWLQLQVGSNGYTALNSDPPAHYLDDITVGLKLHLLDQGAAVPAIAVSAAASLPTFPADGYARTTDGFFIGYLTKDFGWLHIDWNIGVNLWRLEDSPKPQGWTAVAFSTALSPQLTCIGETYFFSDALPLAAEDAGLLLALSYAIFPWLVVDAGGDIGFVQATRAYSVFAGLTVIPFVFWRKGAKSD
jgi:hypothetical protein